MYKETVLSISGMKRIGENKKKIRMTDDFGLRVEWKVPDAGFGFFSSGLKSRMTQLSPIEVPDGKLEKQHPSRMIDS
jgi:hypothetical protein